MKYGEYLKEKMVPGWGPQYIDYDSLKHLIEEKGSGFTEEAFIARVTEEEGRIDLFISGRVVETVNNLRYLETHVDDELAERVAEELIRVESYVRQNLEGFRKIIKKYEKNTGLSTVWYSSNRERRWLFKASRVMHELIVQLSQYYARKLEGDSAGKWEPPTSFSRKTVKYWVSPEHIAQLKLFLIRHLPILELTKSKRIAHDFYKQNVDQSHNYISSVYLDNDEFLSYHTRIRREEGAQLFRVRWYGGEIKAGASLPSPKSKHQIFVERKTHHEAESGLESTKERFPFDLDLLPAFFRGELSAAKAFEIMELQGALKKGDAAKHLALAEEAQEAVVSRGLHPVLRTVYHRTAFQRSDSNQVRISLDFPCYFVKQEDRADFWTNLDYQRAADPFDVGIMELKTTGDESPPWVEQLLETGWLTPVKKFSKFQTTVATFYADKVEVFPHWIAGIEDEEPEEGKEPEKKEKKAKKAVDFKPPPLGVSPDSNYTQGTDLEDFSEPVTPSANGQASKRRESGHIAPRREKPRRSSEVDRAAALSAASAMPRGSADGSTPRVSFDVDDSAPRGSSQSAVASTAAAAAAAPPSKASSGTGRNLRKRKPTAETTFPVVAGAGAGATPTPAGSKPGKPSRASRDLGALGTAPSSTFQAAGGAKGPRAKLAVGAPRSKVKIEPKTYFANERTFIQWLSAAILLVTLSTAIMSFNETARIAGTIFFPVSLLFMYYALFVYYWRLKKINGREGGRFDDPYGPFLLTIVLSLAMMATVAVIWTYDFEGTTGGALGVTSSRGSSSSGTTYDPSDRTVAPVVPLAAAATRLARGCEATPLILPSQPDAFQPTSWEFQQALSASSFATAVGRLSYLRLLESRLSQYYEVTDAMVEWARTEDVYCVPSLYPDCDAHHLRHRRSTEQAIIFFRNLNTSFVAPEPDSSRTGESKYELESSCDGSRLTFSLAVDDVPASPAWNTTNVIDNLLASPLYGTTEPLTVRGTNLNTVYRYVLRELAGATAEVNIEIFYGSEEDRAFGRNAQSADLLLELSGDVTLTSLRQAEGLVETLSAPRETSDSLTDSEIIGVVVGISFLALIVGATVVYLHRRHRKKLKVAEAEGTKA